MPGIESPREERERIEAERIAGLTDEEREMEEENRKKEELKWKKINREYRQLRKQVSK